MTRIFRARIKELHSERILTPSYYGNEYTTKEFIEGFWGLHNKDVEWYELEIEEKEL